MMLADAGADIVRIDRAERATYPPHTEAPRRTCMNRGRRSVAVDLKHPDGVALVLRLVEGADGLMEGFRPGVAERLGLGPEVCLARNPKLVYGRMTGWGQDGPMAQVAGHDIDYIALAGALEPIGRAGEPPLPPLNLVGDFGGGGMLLAFGMWPRSSAPAQTGKGQVVDAAMVDGAASLMTMTYTLRPPASGPDDRGTNLLDTGAHFYEVYETSDGGFIGRRCHRAPVLRRADPAARPRGRSAAAPDGPGGLARDEGAVRPRLRRARPGPSGRQIFDGTDACVTPVLSPSEAPDHPHNQFRAAPSPRWPAWSSRPRRRGSSARPGPSVGLRPTRASTPTRPWQTGDSATRRRTRASGAIG